MGRVDLRNVQTLRLVEDDARATTVARLGQLWRLTRVNNEGTEGLSDWASEPCRGSVVARRGLRVSVAGVFVKKMDWECVGFNK